ncbi:MAG: hypothetical protein SF187_09925 [Deltaproteobacteria bacterium]|nr:hypothetical protein [Deltaproteobacteria bacterium]
MSALYVFYRVRWEALLAPGTIWALSLFLSLWLTSVFADADAVRAQDAFNEGVALMTRAKCDVVGAPKDPCERARQLFDEAFARHPEGLGALRNRAFVEKGLGLWVQARASFRELAARAQNHPSADRRAWVPLALAEAERLTQQIDALPKAESVPATKPLQTRGESAAPTRPRAPSAWTHPSTWLLVGGSAAVATGLGFGAAAWFKHGDVCDEKNVCDRQGLSDARRFATLSNWFVGAGAVVVLGGLAWRALASRPHDEAVGLQISPVFSARDAGFVLRGAF